MRKLTLPFFLFVSFNAAGQITGSVDGKSAAIADSTTNLYFASQGESSVIYSGRIFHGYLANMKGFAYYPGEGWQKGSVRYDDTWYHDISIMYDIYQDEVIIRHPDNMLLRLFSDRVQQFNFLGLTFVRLSADKDNVIKTGFYQKLAEGNLTIFAFHQKKIEENIVDLAVEYKFISSDHYYALKDGRYYPIHKQKALLALVKDSKQNMSKYLKQQGIKYKDETAKAIVTIATLYNQSHK